jgi:hypothetical protein
MLRNADQVHNPVQDLDVSKQRVDQIGSPRPLTSKRVLLTLLVPGGGGTRLRVRVWGGGANSDEGTETLVL